MLIFQAGCDAIYNTARRIGILKRAEKAIHRVVVAGAVQYAGSVGV